MPLRVRQHYKPAPGHVKDQRFVDGGRKGGLAKAMRHSENDTEATNGTTPNQANVANPVATQKATPNKTATSNSGLVTANTINKKAKTKSPTDVELASHGDLLALKVPVEVLEETTFPVTLILDNGAVTLSTAVDGSQNKGYLTTMNEHVKTLLAAMEADLNRDEIEHAKGIFKGLGASMFPAITKLDGYLNYSTEGIPTKILKGDLKKTMTMWHDNTKGLLANLKETKEQKKIGYEDEVLRMLAAPKDAVMTTEAYDQAVTSLYLALGGQAEVIRKELVVAATDLSIMTGRVTEAYNGVVGLCHLLIQILINSENDVATNITYGTSGPVPTNTKAIQFPKISIQRVVGGHNCVCKECDATFMERLATATRKAYEDGVEAKAKAELEDKIRMHVESTESDEILNKVRKERSDFFDKKEGQTMQKQMMMMAMEEVTDKIRADIRGGLVLEMTPTIKRQVAEELTPKLLSEIRAKELTKMKREAIASAMKALNSASDGCGLATAKKDVDMVDQDDDEGNMEDYDNDGGEE